MEILVLVGLFWALPIYVASQQGKAKNRAGFLWGFFLGWLGVICLALLPPRPTGPAAG